MRQGSFYIAGWRVEPALNQLSSSGKTVHLEPKIMQVLVCLAANSGQVIAKDHFLREVWGDAFVCEDVLSRAISELRKAQGDNSKTPSYIETIPKMGYRLVAGIRAERNRSPQPVRQRTRAIFLGFSLAALMSCWTLW